MGRGNRNITAATISKPRLTEIPQQVSTHPTLNELTEAQLNQGYEVTIGEYQSQLTYSLKGENHWLFLGAIKKGDVPVAYFARKFNRKENTVDHESFTVESAYRGLGIAKSFSEKWEDFYRNIGIKQIEMTTASHGSSFWITRGYKPVNLVHTYDRILAPTRHVIDPVTGIIDAMSNIDQLLDKLSQLGHIDNKNEIIDFLSTHPSLEETLALGENKKWKADNGRTLWLGRCLIVGAEYVAVKDL